jgi:hypothetical protein
MTFKHLLCTSLEQTIRSTTRSKGKPSTSGALSSSLPHDDFATVMAKNDTRGPKEKTEVKVTEVTTGENGNKERTGMFKRFETN